MRPPSRTERPAGFTLVELLVTVTLLSIVMAAVYSAFSSTLQMWKRGDTNVDTYQDARTSMSILSRELQNVVVGSEYLFSGTKDSMTFYTAIEPMDVEAGEHTHVAQVTYRLKQDPARRVWTLVREEALVKGMLPLPSKDSGPLDADALKLGKEHTFELAAKLRDMSLTYIWLQPVKGDSLVPGAPKPPPKIVEMDDSPIGTGLPQGIRVTLTFSDEIAKKGRTTFTNTIVFARPTTPLDPDGIVANKAPLR